MIETLTSFPVSPREPIVDVLHGVAVEDPYRWLEDQESQRTRQWIGDQNDYANRYFEGLGDRRGIRERIAELLTIETCEAPVEIGGKVFFLKRQADQQQPSICMRLCVGGEDVVLLDPAQRGEGDTTAIRPLAVSNGGRLLAYGVRHGGEDTQSVEILDVETRQVLPDRLANGTMSGLSFTVNSKSFVYAHSASDGGKAVRLLVRRHALGKSLEEDQVLLNISKDPSLRGVAVLSAGNSSMLFVVSRLVDNQRRTDLYLYESDGNDEPRLLATDIPGQFVPRLVGRRLFALSAEGAPNGRIVQIETDGNDRGAWREIVAEQSARVKSFAVVGERIYVVYAAADRTPLKAYGLEGRPMTPPDLPEGSIAGPWSSPDGTSAFLEFTSFTCPRTLYRIGSNGELTLWHRREILFDPAEIEVRREWFHSKDGTRIPLFLIGKRLDAKAARPTVLSAYGGFGTSLTPQFTAYGTFLVEQGCLLAIANVRGGSEFGVEWHNAAKREKRQNAFDDCLAAAEWLIHSGYTTPRRLGIVGGSNAGLLVGAAITQRPDLFRAAICLGPLLDMLRYHQFGNARIWREEYGCADDPQEFQYLYAYSPYHRVEQGERYPAVLFISGDQDTRCDGAHARKMTARLQSATSSGLPILLDYQEFRGHMSVLPLQIRIDGLTDRLAFLCDQLGIVVQRSRQETR